MKDFYFIDHPELEDNSYSERIFIPTISYNTNSDYRYARSKFKVKLKLLFNYLINYLSLRKSLILNRRLRKRDQKAYHYSYFSDKLTKNGVLPFRASQKLKDKILSRFNSNIMKVRSKRKSFKDYERAVIQCIDFLCSAKDRGDDYKFFEKMCIEYGILDVIEAHKDMPMQLKFVALQINDYTDRGILASCENENGESPVTRYMHIDSGIDTMKCLFYLNNTVKRGSGSFSYVARSHMNETDHRLAARKACDVTNIESIKQKEQMEAFYTLPVYFQHKANFGNDLNIIEKELIITSLISNEIYIEEPIASGCIFNPDGIHRGGFFDNEGERLMLQFMFEPRNIPGPIRQLRRKLKRILINCFPREDHG